MSQGFSSSWEGIKHVAGKALKWAGYGALIMGVIALPVASVAGAAGGVLGLFGVGSGSAAALSALAGPLSFGAYIGGAFGAVKGIATMGEAVEDARDDYRSQAQQQELAQQRRALMAQSRSQAVANGYSAGVSPNVGFGQSAGRGAAFGV